MNEVRRERLRQLIDEKFDGNAKDLAQRLGYASSAFISQMAGPHPTRVVSERTARRIERRLGLPQGWMDHGEVPTPKAGPAPCDAFIHDAVLVCTEIARELFPNSHRSDLKTGQFAQIVALTCEKAAEVGYVDREYALDLFRIVTGATGRLARLAGANLPLALQNSICYIRLADAITAKREETWR